MASSPGLVITKNLKMVLSVFSSGARHKSMDWEIKHVELPVDQPPTVALTVFAYVWPRDAETEIDAALCVIGAGKDLEFFCP